MTNKRFSNVLLGIVLLASAARGLEAATTNSSDGKTTDSLKTVDLYATSAGLPLAALPIAGGLENGQREKSEDPCTLLEVTANPTRPNWDYGASTTQCGILETDYGFLDQSMGGGVGQRMIGTSLRYGLTPKLDLRFALTNYIAQSGGIIQSRRSTSFLEGIGDDWLNVRYRFWEQGKAMPALSLMYGAKIPTANPAKGFGTGYFDHQLFLIASRDQRKNHFDFNVVGTLAGSSRGFDGAAQFGLALTRPITSKLSGILEGYGGPQPGNTNRFGAGFTGATYAVRPTLTIDAGYDRTYTAGSPRQQVLFGFTYARRSGLAPLPKSAALARFLGR